MYCHSDAKQSLWERSEAKSKNLSYVWYWKKRLPHFKDKPCRVLASGRMNSILVEFENGYRVVTSRFAVRLIK